MYLRERTMTATMMRPRRKLAMEAVTTEAAAKRRPWSTLKVPSGMKSMTMAKRDATNPMTMPCGIIENFFC